MAAALGVRCGVTPSSPGSTAGSLPAATPRAPQRTVTSCSRVWRVRSSKSALVAGCRSLTIPRRWKGCSPWNPNRTCGGLPVMRQPPHLCRCASSKGPRRISPAVDGSFDAAVVSLVLCSVPDQRTALRELHRVLREGGWLHFYEHVRSGQPGSARLQDRVDRVWPLFAGGCHSGRDTAGSIEEAGFRLERCRRFEYRKGSCFGIVSPHVIGRAVRV